MDYDDRDRRAFLDRELAGSAPQYVPGNDFPARASRAIEAADHYAGAANDAMARGFGVSDSFYSPRGRSAAEIVQSALPADPNEVARSAMAQYRGGDYVGAAETALGGLPETGAIRAYHGTPYRFDRFDKSKIGSGEGAAAFGHGLYFADSEPTAISYRDGLSQGTLVAPNGQVLRPMDALEHLNVRAATDRHGLDAGIARAEQLMAQGAGDRPHRTAQALQDDYDTLQLWKASGAQPNKGHLYEVNLGVDPRQMLDWDQPIYRQPEVLDALRTSEEFMHPRRPDYSALQVFHRSISNDLKDGVTGRKAYWELSGGVFGDRPAKERDRAASEYLNSIGIPGIQYLDQGSRPALGQAFRDGPSGTHNYVMFDDDLIEILRRYRDGGRVGYASGGSPHEDEERSRFIREQLDSGEKQLPQSNEREGLRTAERAGLMAAGFAPGSGLASASGMMPSVDHEGGFEPSMRQNWREGHYFDAAMQGASALGDVAYAAPGVGTVLGGALKAPMAAKMAMAAVPAAARASKAVAREAKAVEEATEAGAKAANAAPAEQFTASTPTIIRPNEVPTRTVRSILEGNGYDLPEGLSFGAELDRPARPHTLNSLSQEISRSVRDHLALPEGQQEAAAMRARETMAKYVGRDASGDANNLISQNAKLSKAKNVDDKVYNHNGVPVDTWGLSLSPYLQWENLNLCPHGQCCGERCLGKRGGYYAFGEGFHDNYAMNPARERALARSIALMQDTPDFAVSLLEQLRGQAAMSRSKGYAMAARLNTLSDLHPGVFRSIREAMPGTMFYDYTKVPLFVKEPNFHQTLSSTGISTPEIANEHSNWPMVMKALEDGRNVAMVVSEKNAKPSKVVYKDREFGAVSGDEHDYRPNDRVEPGQPGQFVILGRKDNSTNAKEAMRASNGFYVGYDPKKDGDTLVIPDQEPFRRKKRASGGRTNDARKDGLPEGIYLDQFHNHHHYEDVEKAIPILRGKDRRSMRR